MNNYIKSKLALFYFVLYLGGSIAIPFIQVFLEHLGYNVVQRGIMLTSAAIIATITQLVIGYIADKYKTDRWPFNITLIIIVISAYLFYISNNILFTYHLILVSLLLGLFKTINASQDAWLLGINQDCKNNFGRIRAFASLAWVIGSFAGGIIIKHYDYSTIGYIFVICSIIVLLISFIIPEGKRENIGPYINIKDIKLLFNNKGFIIATLVLLGVEIIFMAGQYTLVDKFILLNSSTETIGLYWSIQSLVELPLFLLAPRLLMRYKDYNMLMIATIIYIIRFILYGYVQTSELLIIVTLSQAITFPLLMIVSKTIIDRFIPDNMKATGQTISMAIYVGLPSLLVPLISGYLIDIFNVDFALYIFGLSGIIPIILLIYLVKNIINKEV